MVEEPRSLSAACALDDAIDRAIAVQEWVAVTQRDFASPAAAKAAADELFGAIDRSPDAAAALLGGVFTLLEPAARARGDVRMFSPASGAIVQSAFFPHARGWGGAAAPSATRLKIAGAIEDRTAQIVALAGSTDPHVSVAALAVDALAGRLLEERAEDFLRMARSWSELHQFSAVVLPPLEPSRGLRAPVEFGVRGAAAPSADARGSTLASAAPLAEDELARALYMDEGDRSDAAPFDRVWPGQPSFFFALALARSGHPRASRLLEKAIADADRAPPVAPPGDAAAEGARLDSVTVAASSASGLLHLGLGRHWMAGELWGRRIFCCRDRYASIPRAA